MIKSLDRPSDQAWDMVLNVAVRLAIVGAVIGLLVYSCGNNDHSITDCSSRHKPQHYDHGSGRWTCGEGKNQ